MRKVIIYSKDGCHLCEKVIAELEKLRGVESFDLTSQNITESSELYERYKNIIPVVSVDGVVKLAGADLSNPLVLNETLKKAIIFR